MPGDQAAAAGEADAPARLPVKGRAGRLHVPSGRMAQLQHGSIVQ